MSVAPTMAPPPALPPPLSSGAPPGAPPPTAQPFQSALAEEWARTAPAEGQQKESRQAEAAGSPPQEEAHRRAKEADRASTSATAPGAEGLLQGLPREGRFDSALADASAGSKLPGRIQAGRGALASTAARRALASPGKEADGMGRTTGQSTSVLTAEGSASAVAAEQSSSVVAVEGSASAVATEQSASGAGSGEALPKSAGAGEAETRAQSPDATDRSHTGQAAAASSSLASHVERSGAVPSGSALAAASKGSLDSARETASGAQRPGPGRAGDSSARGSSPTAANSDSTGGQSAGGASGASPSKTGGGGVAPATAASTARDAQAARTAMQNGLAELAGARSSGGNGEVSADDTTSSAGAKAKAGAGPRAVLAGSARARAAVGSSVQAASAGGAGRSTAAQTETQLAQVAGTEAQPDTSAPAEGPLLDAGVDLQDMIDSIHATVELAARQGMSQARIALEPAELGQIRIHLSQTSQGLLARVTADSDDAAQALAAARSELHHALSSLGTSLLRLDIGSFSQPGGREGRQAEGANGSSSSRSARTTEDDASIDTVNEPVGSSPAPRLPLGGLVDVLA